MLPVRFEPTISAGERLQTYALDRAAPGTGTVLGYWLNKLLCSNFNVGEPTVFIMKSYVINSRHT